MARGIPDLAEIFGFSTAEGRASHRLESETRATAKCVGIVPRFFFHLHNDLDCPDDEGVELPDITAARAHAMWQARVTFAETAKDHGRVVLHHRIDIEDEEGNVVDTVHFGDAVTVED